MKRRVIVAATGILIVCAVLPARGDHIRYGTILAGGGTQDCATNVGCGLWADGTTCNPNHPFGHSNNWGHAYNLQGPTEADKPVHFVLTDVNDAGVGDPVQVVFHTRDEACAPIGATDGTTVVEMTEGESLSFDVPGLTKWLVVYMTGVSSVQIAFEITLDRCHAICEEAAAA